MKTIIKRVTPKFLKRYKNKLEIVHQQKKVAKICRGLIDDYEKGRLYTFPIHPKKDFADERIIWQYWGQGYEKVPEMVRFCLKSVERYKGDFLLVRLTDDNVSEYLDFPPEIYQKSRVFLKAHFSDLLRVALLTTYGGVWLDATILLTDSLPEYYFKYDFFMFQRDNKETNKKYWKNEYLGYWGWNKNFKVRVLNSVIYSHKQSKIIQKLCDIQYWWWMTQKSIPHYYFIQILFNELISEMPNLNCPIVSDCLPHYLMTIVSEEHPRMSFQEAL